MKKLLKSLGLVLLLSLSSCYDDSLIWESLEDHEYRIAQLEELTADYNTNLVALQTIVNALKDQDYVTGMIPIERNGKAIGFTVIFSKKNSVTIYFDNESDGVNETYIPEIGIAMDTDGIYYWTLDGAWITDENGNKIPATGKEGKDGEDGKDGKDGKDGEDGKDGLTGAQGNTPKLKISEGKWMVSYDGGETWEILGDVQTSDPGTSEPDNVVFSNIEINDNSVIFTLTDGTEIIVPKKSKVDFKITDIGYTKATFTGTARPISPDYEVGVYYTTDSKVQVQRSEKASCIDFDENHAFAIEVKGLKPNTTYYWRPYVSMYGDIEYGEVGSFTTEQSNNLVEKITYTTVDMEGKTSGWTLEYTYGENLLPVKFVMSNFGYEDETWADVFIYNIIDDGSSVTYENYYHDKLESRCSLTFDSKDRVSAITSIHEDYNESFTLEYNPDDTHKNVNIIIDDSQFIEFEYSYMDNCLHEMMITRCYEEGETMSDIMTFPSIEDFPNKIPADKVNVDLNMVHLLSPPEEGYRVLTHLGYCGKGFSGAYLCEKIAPDFFFSNFIDYDRDYWGDTMDPDYREHFTKTVYRKRENNWLDLSYEFDEEGYPVKLMAEAPVDKYIVEYDLVAGRVISEWEEYYDDTIVVNRIYEIAISNIQEEFVETVYETLEGKIEYIKI